MKDAPTKTWDTAYKYFESLEVKFQSIYDVIDATGEVTRKQHTAVENMIGGLRKWIEY